MSLTRICPGFTPPTGKSTPSMARKRAKKLWASAASKVVEFLRKEHGRTSLFCCVCCSSPVPWVSSNAVDGALLSFGGEHVRSVMPWSGVYVCSLRTQCRSDPSSLRRTL